MGTKTRSKASAAGRLRHRLGLGNIAGAGPAPYPGFIEPCQATQKARPSNDGRWVHEIKHDGYWVQAHLREGIAALYTRRGYDWSDKFSPIAEQLTGGRTHPRVRPGFPIAAPTTWHALEKGIKPNAFALARPFGKSS